MKFIFLHLIESIIRNISGPVGRQLRKLYYSRILGSCGINLIIDIGVVIENPKDIYLGDNVWLDNFCILIAGKVNQKFNIENKYNRSFEYSEGELHLKGNNHIAPFSLIQAHGGVVVGKDVTIASGSKVYSLSHHYRNTVDESDLSQYYFSTMSDINNQFFIKSPVVIGNGAAIGLNTVILPGTVIPDGTWVGVSTYMTGSNNLGNSVYATQAAAFVKNKK